MKILSLNLHNFFDDNFEKKINLIYEFILKNDVDVCLFQEVCQMSNSYKIDNLIKVGNPVFQIARKLNYFICYHPFKKSLDNFDEGLAIISKYQIKDVGHQTISRTMSRKSSLRRDFITATIKGITFFNVQVGKTESGETGIRQIKRLLSFTNKHQELMYVCGDFNHSNSSEEIKLVKKHLYSTADLVSFDAFLNPTVTDLEEVDSDRMVDFIFSNLPVCVKDFSVVLDKPRISNHNAVLLEVYDA